MNKKRIIIAILLSALLVMSGCSGGDTDTEPAETYQIAERSMLSFAPSMDAASAMSSAKSSVLNFVYLLSKGEYKAALEYCYIPNGVLFDENSLQRAVLADGIARAETIAYYAFSESSGKCNVEYDLTLGEQTGTYNKTLYVTQDENGFYKIDLKACNYVAVGSLTFKVPHYVDAYINGVLIDKSKYLDANFKYNITQGVASIPSKKLVAKDDDDDSTKSTETVKSSEDMILTLKSKFGVEQDYPICFMGQSGKAKDSVNDKYYDSHEQCSYFHMDCPREFRESAATYMSNVVLPSLFNDLVHTVTWETASIQSCFGEETESASMFPAYYDAVTKFTKAKAEENGGYYYGNVSTYGFEIIDLDRRSGLKTEITDWNSAQFAVTISYTWLYTKGKTDTEYANNGSVAGVITLGHDAAGNWYVKNISDTLFALNALA